MFLRELEYRRVPRRQREISAIVTLRIVCALGVILGAPRVALSEGIFPSIAVLLDPSTDSSSGEVSVSTLLTAASDVRVLAVLAVISIATAVLIYLRVKRQARELATSRMDLRMIFDHMTEGILVLEETGKTVLMNQAAGNLLSMPGGSYQTVVDQFDAFTPDGVPLLPDQWPSARALRGDFVKNFEILYRRKGTTEIGAREISSASVPPRMGRPGQVILTYRDRTERWRGEQVRARLAAIVESSEDAIIGIDIEGRITSWNHGAQKIYGYTADEVVGQFTKMLIPEEGRNSEDDILARIRRGEHVENSESIRVRKDGERINISLTVSPIRGINGEVIGASKIARDITQQRRLENQLRQSQKLEAIGQLTGGIAHDFNNLLGVVIGYLDLLQERLVDESLELSYVQTAQKAALRGADLTRRLQTFSSKQDLKPAPTSLNHSIRNMLELAAHALGPEISISMHLDATVPDIMVDVAALDSALLNLAVNARDAMQKGGSLTISTQVSRLEEGYHPIQTGELTAGLYACVSVTDTGHGMSRETAEHALEPFFTTKPRGKGSGLGLAMVYGFVKQSGGTVRIYSELNYGTTVSLYLPLASEERIVSPAAADPVAAVKRGTVLVVDDEEDLLTVAVAFLAAMGHTALPAKDGVEALALLERHAEVDMLITDIIMPGGMNGVELAQKTRKLRPGIRVIYCSGFPADVLGERSMPLIDGPLLRKPYQRAEFQAMVQDVMNGEYQKAGLATNDTAQDNRN